MLLSFGVNNFYFDFWGLIKEELCEYTIFPFLKCLWIGKHFGPYRKKVTKNSQRRKIFFNLFVIGTLQDIPCHCMIKELPQPFPWLTLYWSNPHVSKYSSGIKGAGNFKIVVSQINVKKCNNKEKWLWIQWKYCYL